MTDRSDFHFEPVLLAQITDTHIAGSAQPEELYVDNNHRLNLAVTRLNAETVQPDAVLATGDLTDLGTDVEMAILTDLLAPLRSRLLPLPGNHDRRDSFIRTFDMPWASESNLSWIVEVGGVQIIGLDTVVVDRDSVWTVEEMDHGGQFDQERADWLDAALRTTAPRPTVIAMHHPPFVTGIAWMDTMGLRGTELFAEVISHRPHLGRIFCGHIHRTINTTVAGVPTSTGLSTVHQVELNLDPSGPVQVICDPPGYQLHRFNGSDWVSHTRHIDTGADPIDPDWS